MSTLPARKPRKAPAKILTTLPEGTTISAEEAVDRFPFITDICDPEEEGIEEVLVFDGDSAVQGVESFGEPDRKQIIVIDGNLWCAHGFVQSVHQDDDGHLAMFITGNLSAANLCLFGDAQVWVKGNVEVEDLVVAGGGSAGFLQVDGTLTARLVVATTDNQISAKAMDAVVVGGPKAIDGAKPQHARPGELGAVFAPDVLVAGELELRACCRAVEAGKPTLV